MKPPSRNVAGNGKASGGNSFESGKASAREQSAADAKARDAKTARLRAQRLAQQADAQNAAKPDASAGTFKKSPPRKKQAVTKVALSPEAKQRYEQLARDRDERQRGYEEHLPSDKR